jgi:hypothetical protein
LNWRIVLTLPPLILAGCELLEPDPENDAPHGTLTISERSDFVPDGRLPNGPIRFVHKGVGSGPGFAVGSEDGVIITVLAAGDGEPGSCFRMGGFCTLRADQPRVMLTDVSAAGVAQYIPISGTLHIDSVAPYVVRISDAAMRVAPGADGIANGTFQLDGKLRSDY